MPLLLDIVVVGCYVSRLAAYIPSYSGTVYGVFGAIDVHCVVSKQTKNIATRKETNTSHDGLGVSLWSLGCLFLA